MYSYNYNDYSEDELYHHGVKGMKWGVRKAIKNTGSAVLRKALRNKNARRADKYDKKADKAAKKAMFKPEGSLRKQYLTTKSKNYRALANTERKISKKSFGKRLIANKIISPERLDTPYTRMSGRKTTIGRNAFNYAMTGGLAGVVLDAKYLYNNKNK